VRNSIIVPRSFAIIVTMRTDKEKAFELRRQGKSYKTISDELGMSKSTLSHWFKSVDFSEEVKKHLSKEVYVAGKQRLLNLNTTRGVLLKVRYEYAEKEALEDLKQHYRNPLFVAAVAAYWGEGDKANNGLVRLINTDPKMIALFKRFLTEIANVQEEKLRGALYIYNDLDEATCKKFWIKRTGLKHFHKTMTLPSRQKDKKVHNGMCSLVVSSTYLKKKMLVWIDHLPEMVLNIPAE